MDKAVVQNKLESLRRCVCRIEEKTPGSAEVLASDLDLQDIIALNLERAVQVCVDMGLHIISDLEIPVPETMAGTFDALKTAGCLDAATAELVEGPALSLSKGRIRRRGLS